MRGYISRKALMQLLLYIVVFLGSATDIFAGVPSTVFENVLSYNKHVYARTIDTMTWADANTLATTHGGYLVTVNDSAESQFLAANYASGNPWIGLTDADNPGTWVWAYGWTTYTNWAPDEPSGGGEHCVVTNWGLPGVWNDGNCPGSSTAIVEWNSVPGAIHLPQTSQTMCYNEAGTEIACAGTIQDGAINSGVVWPVPRFTVSGECVTDNLTGLMWAKSGNLPGGTRYWQGALDYIVTLNSVSLCGNADWRLPNAKELQSLTRPGDTDNSAWLNGQGFTGMLASSYWGSSTGAYNTAYGVTVTMNAAGQMSHGLKSGGSYYVLPVRGSSLGPARVPKTGQAISYDANNPQRDDGALQAGTIWPEPRFTASSDCGVIDNLTGLIWTKNGNLDGLVTWQTALDYAVSLNAGAGLCGRTDWRLPNLYEMKSLINHGESSTASWLNTQGFTSAQISNYYWTSSNYMANAWKLHMGGTSLFDPKSSTGYVWPVSGRICYENLARRSDTGTTNYSSIQDAYDAATSDHTLKTRASAYCEDVYFDGVTDIILAGGHDQGFASQAGHTIIYGSVTVIGGSVRAEYITIL